MVTLYAWAKPALMSGVPVDHAWVTSYDSEQTAYSDIDQVQYTGEQYWYCRGRFHQQGRFIGRRGYCSEVAACLVEPNSDRDHGRGTIQRYGIDGVCHQLANQVLYRASWPAMNLYVAGARGYKLSSAIYGDYGRKERQWSAQKQQCGIAYLWMDGASASFRSWRNRLRGFLRQNYQQVIAVETLRSQLLRDLDEIGLANRGANESVAERVQKLNRRINNFLTLAQEALRGDTRMFIELFGVEPHVEINLIDPTLFEFPDDGRLQ